MTEGKKNLLRMKALLVKIGASKSSIYEKIEKGQFPAPIKLGPRTVAWLESEVDRWIDERVSESRRGSK